MHLNCLKYSKIKACSNLSISFMYVEYKIGGWEGDSLSFTQMYLNVCDLNVKLQINCLEYHILYDSFMLNTEWFIYR